MHQALPRFLCHVRDQAVGPRFRLGFSGFVGRHSSVRGEKTLIHHVWLHEIP